MPGEATADALLLDGLERNLDLSELLRVRCVDIMAGIPDADRKKVARSLESQVPHESDASDCSSAMIFRGRTLTEASILIQLSCPGCTVWRVTGNSMVGRYRYGSSRHSSTPLAPNIIALRC